MRTLIEFSSQLVFSRFLGSLASSTFVFYVFHKVFLETQSAFLMGSIGLILFLPSICLNLYAGNLTDKLKKVGISYHYIILFKLIFISSTLLFNSFNFIIIVLFAISILRSFRVPLYYSMLKTIKYNPAHSAKLNTISWQLPIILAPALVTGSSYFNFSPFSTLVFITFIQFLEYLFTFRFKALVKKYSTTPKSLGVIASMRELQILKRKDFFAPFFIDAVLASFMGLTVLIPFVLLDLNADEKNFGFIKSLFHFSALLAVILIPKSLIEKMNLRFFAIIVGIWSVLILALGMNQSLMFFIILIVCFGLLDGASCILREQFLLKFTKDGELGRVSSLNGLLIATGDELGEFNTGLWIESIGWRLSLYVTFFITFMISMLLFKMSNINNKMLKGIFILNKHKKTHKPKINLGLKQ